mgnify:CR=1 FL=1
MSSKAYPRACPEEAQADENPHELPIILKQATRLKLKVPEMEETIPVGEQRIGPNSRIRLILLYIIRVEPADAV